MRELSIRVSGVGKWYRLGQRERYRALRDVLARAVSFRRHDTTTAASSIWALEDVSLEIPQGEILGVIGRNGAGKSTLLKVLARITEPTTGRVELHGRVGSLLEVGTGFHPELTGRENVYLNGAILGMTHAEVRRNFDRIVAFAELERFMDTPVKHYSTGMFMRLAFAVAAHLETEILLVDEVLAVGDAQFQKKCVGKMDDVARQGRTVLFVSHNMNAVVNLCSRVAWLDQGRVRAIGEPASIVSSYLSDEMLAEQAIAFTGSGKHQSPEVTIQGARIEAPTERLTNGTPFEVRFQVQLHKPVDYNFVFSVYREGALAFVCQDYHEPAIKAPLAAGQVVEVGFSIPPYLLNPGYHAFSFSVVDRGGNAQKFARVDEVLPRVIEDDQVRRGGQYLLGWNGAVSPLLSVSLQLLDSHTTHEPISAASTV